MKKPPCVWMPTINYSTRMGVAIDTIALHNTAARAFPALAWLRNHESKVSAHYLVDREGHIAQLVRDDMCAWHAGDREMNRRSIGVEIVSWKDERGMTEFQESSLVALVSDIVDWRKVSIDRIIPHRRCRATLCPGYIWPSDADFDAWVQAKITSGGSNGQIVWNNDGQITSFTAPT